MAKKQYLDLAGLTTYNDEIQTQLDSKSDTSHTHDTYMTKENPTGTGSFSLNRKADTTIGNYSVAEGNNNEASGVCSHAEGLGNIASGGGSHAEGGDTIASGLTAHAEGGQTIASNMGAHAEGVDTTASGIASHSEGNNTVASGIASHSEGSNLTSEGSELNSRTISATDYPVIGDTDITIQGSTAQGISSHAEGVQTFAFGYASHAEGYGTTALGLTTHVEGNFTTATGEASHAEGAGTTASGAYAHAEGRETKTLNGMAHAEGWKTTASGEASHAEGYNTIAEGRYSHAEGYNSEAIGIGAHAEGTTQYNIYENDGSGWNVLDDTSPNTFIGRENETITYVGQMAYGAGSHAEGHKTLASEDCSHAEGHYTIASGHASHAEGFSTTASGNDSHAEGRHTTASGQASHAEGKGTTASGDYSHASGYETTAAGDYQFVIGKLNDSYVLAGKENNYAFIIGNGEEDANGVSTLSNAMTVDWNGDVRANHFVVPNGYAVRSASTTGEEHGLISLSTSNNIMIGSYNSSGHPGNTYINAYNGDVYLRNKTASIRFESHTTSNIAGVFRPVTDTKCSIGRADYRWYRLWAASSAVQTSDEREKSDIMSLSDYPATYSRNGSGNIFEQLYDKLIPKTYTLNIEGNEDVHIGFVAQDIAASMAELGLSEDDLGLIDHSCWIDEETGEEKDRYGLCYEEFAALNTYMIQKQKARITELETQLADQEERIAKLEALIA